MTREGEVSAGFASPGSVGKASFDLSDEADSVGSSEPVFSVFSMVSTVSSWVGSSGLRSPSVEEDSVKPSGAVSLLMLSSEALI